MTGPPAMAAGLPPPQPHVGGDPMRFLASLQSLRDTEFDREYARRQVLIHASPLTTMRSYAVRGSNPDLRRAAGFAVPLVGHHLRMARPMKDAICDA